ncbi:efflux RND transporter periplasmic adaptor subunit [Anaerophaga thermohalophila]|jgi:multidrug efflux pump subunit AcrA (membrane-fusion protein)|uniref:efflux RND transporter periplasmic adaptor subunit n=1 Tax=Anaerophaga thermohalophila TaxID=177400 RepID=UPI00030FD3A6|nr:efflux RND transporter periplasmic adaptor subunit [Anaerophaga thermohalophila]
MKQRLWILLPLVLVILAFIGYRLFWADETDGVEVAEVIRGKFEQYVTSIGELEAHKSTDILIPDVLTDRTVRIRDITINDLVREGTEVEKGDYVATLDPSGVEEHIKSTRETLDMLEANLEQARMDSSLNLSEARDAIRQAKDNVLDKEIKVEQSVYESKAVQRQAQIELEKAQRNLEQKKRNYRQLKRKNEISVQRIEEQFRQEENNLKILMQLKSDLIIRAPASGIVVYVREWNGEKRKVGSTVSRWDPRIAILPDLSTILSVTYVKEIDVTKVYVGMPVKITIDAFPEEEFNGTVRTVANIGKEIEGQFLNGFKVEIEVDPKGFELLPGMTSVNRFIIREMDDQLMVPREAVFVEGAEQVVYKKTPLGIVKQEVETGGENDEFIRIVKGLNEGDKVVLTPPE